MLAWRIGEPGRNRDILPLAFEDRYGPEILRRFDRLYTGCMQRNDLKSFSLWFCQVAELPLPSGRASFIFCVPSFLSLVLPLDWDAHGLYPYLSLTSQHTGTLARANPVVSLHMSMRVLPSHWSRCCSTYTSATARLGGDRPALRVDLAAVQPTPLTTPCPKVTATP